MIIFRLIALIVIIGHSDIAGAAPLRVTAWDWQPPPSANVLTPAAFQQELIPEAAERLTAADSDVILLQHVAGREICLALVAALRPAKYQVAACSAISNVTGHSASGQAAILVRGRSYLSWTETFSNSAGVGGFAFAAVRVNGKNIGVFSVQTESGPPAVEMSVKVVKHIETTLAWKKNRLQAMVLAGPSGLGRWAALEKVGFTDVLAEGPAVVEPAEAAAVDSLFSCNAANSSAPVISTATLFHRYGVTCELDLLATPMEVPPLQKLTVLPAPAAPAAVAVRAPTPAWNWWPYALAFLGAGFFLLGWWRMPARSSVPALRENEAGSGRLPPRAPFVQIEIEGSTQTGSQTLYPRPPQVRPSAPLPEEIRRGVVISLTEWLKKQWVQRLMADRTNLRATQEIAARQVQAMDSRLAKIEQQVQSRNLEYEKRIDHLWHELAAAKEENRALIRAKIDLLKSAMEKNRAISAASEPFDH